MGLTCTCAHGLRPDNGNSPIAGDLHDCVEYDGVRRNWCSRHEASKLFAQAAATKGLSPMALDNGSVARGQNLIDLPLTARTVFPHAGGPVFFGGRAVAALTCF